MLKKTMPRKSEKTIIEEIKSDIGKYGSFEILAQSEGGKLLIAGLENDFISSIDNLVMNYKKEKIEKLFPLIAEIDITLKFLRVFLRASEQKKGALIALKNEEKEKEEEL